MSPQADPVEALPTTEGGSEAKLDPSPEKRPADNRIRVHAVGDIMLADQHCSLGFGFRSRYQGRYMSSVADPTIKSALADADLLLGNLECSYNDSPDMRIRDNVMTTHGEGLDFLRSLGFQALSLANNHTLERGRAGLETLKAALDARNIQYFGTADKPFAKLNVRGHRIAVLGVNAVPDHKNSDDLVLYDPVEIGRRVREARTEADLVVVYIHWGNELIGHPSPAQFEMARNMADAGADLIVGAHPHVLQPVSRLGTCLVAYSTGNLLADSYSSLTFPTGIFRFEWDPRDRQWQWDVLPLFTDGQHRLHWADREQTFEIRRLLESTPHAWDEHDYNAQVVKLRQRFRRETLAHIVHHLWQYEDRAGVIRWAARRGQLLIKNWRRERKAPSDVYRWQ